VLDARTGIFASGSADYTMRLYRLRDAASFLMIGAPFNKNPAAGHTESVQKIVRIPPVAAASNSSSGGHGGGGGGGGPAYISSGFTGGFASASFDRTIRLWSWSASSLDRVRCVAVLRGHLDGVWALRYLHLPLYTAGAAPPGLMAAALSADSKSYAGDTTPTTSGTSASGSTTSMAIGGLGTTGGHFLFSGGSDGFIRIWHLNSLSCVKVLDGHSGDVYCLDVRVISAHPERGYALVLASGSADQTVVIRDFVLPVGSASSTSTTSGLAAAAGPVSSSSSSAAAERDTGPELTSPSHAAASVTVPSSMWSKLFGSPAVSSPHGHDHKLN
jgi:WD40 repeat protein